MKIKCPFASLVFGLLLAWGGPRPVWGGAAEVRVERTPFGGIQPQAVVDDRGVTHLIVYKGDARAGDVYYATRKAGGSFAEPVRVNRQAGSAVAAGSIRGAQLALGKNSRVHVVWNGSQNAAPGGDFHKAPLLYTRTKDEGTGFEPERNIITYAWGLDGGSSVAADGSGNVYVAWHASPPGNEEGEAGRAVFVARSLDEGATFGSESRASLDGAGACGCCGMKAFADAKGGLGILYRAAGEKIHRDAVLLRADGPGGMFREVYRHPWQVNSCPMSSAWLSAGGANGSAGMLAAWETDQQVYIARANIGEGDGLKPVAAPGTGKRKFPVAVGNARGEVLLAWAEETGWERGGRLAWQVFDSGGRPTDGKGEADGVPVWSFPAAVVEQDGVFRIFY